MKKFFTFLLFSFFALLGLGSKTYLWAYAFECARGCEALCGGDQACLWRCFTCCPPEGVQREVDCLLCEGRWQSGRCLSGEESRGMLVGIKVNGSQAPGVVRDRVRISVSLDPQGQTGTGDYFLWARIPGGDCYCYAYPGLWNPCSCTDPAPAYQGGLVFLNDFFVPPAVSAGQLPVGDYTLYFAVDAQMNSLLDEDAARDEVQFSIGF